jgi:hypothetical protein
MAVTEEWTYEAGVAAGTFSGGPPVVGTCLADVDFLPGALADVVDVQVSGARLKSEGEGVAKSQRLDCTVAASSATEKWVAGRNAAVFVDAQYLP